jgi:dihydrolipoamide dehydrogenase
MPGMWLYLQYIKGVRMKEYDFIVIGSGSGMLVVNEALSHGAKVALVDKGPRLGGTCLNYGCIPSKMLIHPADRIMEIRKSNELGVTTKIEDIDFDAIMTRMRESRDGGGREVREGIGQLSGLDFYEGEGCFVDGYTLEINGEKIRADTIFIASGARPFVPLIEGLDDVDFLTNESALELKEKPRSIIIIGGGYIGVEYAHFFEAMGVTVTIMEMADRLILSEEPEIADVLLKELGQRMRIHLNTRVVEVGKVGAGVKVITEDANNGKQTEFRADTFMVAMGRRSNADLLKVENTGVEVDKRGFIKVNEYLETSMKNIFAVGDANGQQMFTHVANREAALAINNVLHEDKAIIDRSAVPHAVYSYPPIASVGLNEKDARESHQVLVGRTHYYEVAKGEAMLEKEGFAKAILDKESGNILGFHIIGPQAPILIQEVVNAMTFGGHGNEINEGIHIHPALSELIPVTLNGIEEVP